MERVRQLERRQEDIDTAVQTIQELRDASKCYVDHPANLQADDQQIGDFALMHETKLQESDGAELDASLRGPYRVPEIPQSLGTYHLA